MRRALVVGAILLLPALAAGCTFPNESKSESTELRPVFTGVRGLTPEPRSHPVAVHITSDGARAYVALAGTIARPDDRLAIIDLAKGALDGHIQVGTRPLAMANDPQHPERLLVAHPYASWLSIIDTDRGTRIGTLPVPYYVEDLAFSPDGDHLVVVDRDRDRLIVYAVTRDGGVLSLDERTSLATGPNPQDIVFVPPPEGADWSPDRLVAVSDRHGASITLADLETQAVRRLDTGGAPLALAARDGLVFVAGYVAGDGTGTPVDEGRTIDPGSATVENSLLVVDVRQGPAAVADPDIEIPAHRYLSDTAHPERAHEAMRLLGGAAPRALTFDDDPLPGHSDANGTILWVTYQGSDQVQALRYSPPDTAASLSTHTIRSMSDRSGERLSHLDAARPLAPGRLSDTVHGLYETPPGPRAVARVADMLVVVAEFPELVQLVDLTDCAGARAPLAGCRSITVGVVADPRPYPDGPFETGERLFFSALPSADQDRSCASCHVDGLSSGGTVRLPHREEPVRIPRLDQVADNAPWLLDGSVKQPKDYLNAAGGDLLRGDPSDPANLANDTSDPDAQHPGIQARIERLGTNLSSAGDYMRHTWAWALGEERLLPAPPRLAPTTAGMRLFENPQAACASCHLDDGRRANLLSPERSADIPRPEGTDRIKVPALGGLWDRQGTGYLYDGRATTLQEAILSPEHRCLDADETGHGGAWHGDLGARTCDTIDALVRHLMGQVARR